MNRYINLTDWQAVAANEGRIGIIVIPAQERIAKTLDKAEKAQGRPGCVNPETLCGDIILRYPVGTILLGRETWGLDHWDGRSVFLYKADSLDACETGWKSPIIMPDDAVRHRFRVTANKLRLVQTITDSECIPCGVGPFGSSLNIDCDTISPKCQFAINWDRHQRVKRHPELAWACNPWCEFLKVEVVR